jgi:hypothetical protein
MEKLRFNIEIYATREQVWDAIVNVEKYRIWTAPFYPGSYFVGGWNTGDTIRFLALNEAGEKGGMVAKIHSSVFPHHISIQHLGFVTNGVDDTTSEEVKKWAPSFENYTITSINEAISLFEVEMDLNEEFFETMLEIWPKALDELKNVCENQYNVH